MLEAIEVDCVQYLEVVDPLKPVLSGSDAELMVQDMQGGFALWPVGDSTMSTMKRMPASWVLVSTSKKDSEAIRKLGLQIKKITPSVSDVIKSASRLSELTRQSMAIANLKDIEHQIQAAIQIALLGETKEHIETVVNKFPSGRAFALQDAMLSLNLKKALDILNDIDPNSVIEVGGLLLSGHIVAFASASGVDKTAKALGHNRYYVERITMASSRYVKRVDFVKSTDLLSTILDRVKHGENPAMVLRSTIIGVLTSQAQK